MVGSNSERMNGSHYDSPYPQYNAQGSMSMRTAGGTSAVLTEAEHEDLLKRATQVEQLEGEREPHIGNKVLTHTVKRKVHIPIEREVKVPIVSKKVETHMEKTVVRGTKLVPKKKYKDVTETVLETKEEVVHGFREKWVKIKEPTTEMVKKQVPVNRTRRVSYVDYEEEAVERVVEVPKDVLKEVHGFRTDKQIGTKVVEVEEDVHYEVKPIYMKNGERRVRDTGDIVVHGKMHHGDEKVVNEYTTSHNEGPVADSSSQLKAVARPGLHSSRYYTTTDYMERPVADLITPVARSGLQSSRQQYLTSDWGERTFADQLRPVARSGLHSSRQHNASDWGERSDGAGSDDYRRSTSTSAVGRSHFGRTGGGEGDGWGVSTSSMRRSDLEHHTAPDYYNPMGYRQRNQHDQQSMQHDQQYNTSMHRQQSPSPYGERSDFMHESREYTDWRPVGASQRSSMYGNESPRMMNEVLPQSAPPERSSSPQRYA